MKNNQVININYSPFDLMCSIQVQGIASKYAEAISKMEACQVKTAQILYSFYLLLHIVLSF